MPTANVEIKHGSGEIITISISGATPKIVAYVANSIRQQFGKPPKSKSDDFMDMLNKAMGK